MNRSFKFILILLFVATGFTLWLEQKQTFTEENKRLRTDFLKQSESFAFSILNRAVLDVPTPDSIYKSIVFGDLIFVPKGESLQSSVFAHFLIPQLDKAKNQELIIHSTADYIYYALPKIEDDKVQGFWITQFNIPAEEEFTIQKFSWFSAVLFAVLFLVYWILYNPIVLGYSRVQRKVNDLRNQVSDKAKENEGLKRLVERNNEINKRNIFFADEIQKLKSTGDVGKSFLTKLSEELGLVQAVFFNYSTRDKQLKAEGGYAVTKDLETLFFEPGQGLVGEVYQTRKITILEKTPADYLKIESGLGNTGIASIALIPLQSGDAVLGVLEVASFKPFDEFDKNFFESLSRNLGARISMLK
ncbi:MAG: GAF domain-containing protein [Luteibaculaceae bacterium]